MGERGLDTIIEGLTAELEPVRRLAHPMARIIPLIILVLLYEAGAVYYFGLRPDITVKMQDQSFLFETGLMLSIALSATLATAWMCIPDMRGQKWVISVPITLTIVFSAWILLRSWMEGVTLPSLHWHHCYSTGLLMGVVPGAGLMFLSNRGTTTRPYIMALINILAITAFSYVGLRLICASDTVGHSCLAHILPFVVLGALIGIGARRIFSW